jgi:ABC-type multidrug transport system fused ATPase/permease subunit
MLNENISGMIEIQLFNQERKMFEKFNTVNHMYKNEWNKIILYHAIFTPIVTLIGAVANSIIIYYGANQIIHNIISVGIVVAFLSYVERFFAPIRDLAEKYTLLQNAMTSAERIFRLLDTHEVINEIKNPLPIPKEKGNIKYVNVYLSYDNKTYALENINLEIQKGESVALVGHTGAGKTSLCSILLRLFDIQKGEILLNNININLFSLEELRKYIGYISQEPFIFTGTIIFNIKLNDKNISNEDVEKICYELNMNTWIEELPNKYNELLKERGCNLSTGQKQLISCARVLVRNPKLVIIDEGTSSIDSKYEKVVIDALKKIMKGRTTLVITHRFSLIPYVDRIIVLDKGKIVGEGTHEELVHNNEIYNRLYNFYKNKELHLTK